MKIKKILLMFLIFILCVSLVTAVYTPWRTKPTPWGLQYVNAIWDSNNDSIFLSTTYNISQKHINLSGINITAAYIEISSSDFINITVSNIADITNLKATNLERNLDGTGFNITADQFKGNINWSGLQNYPAACPAGSAITKLNDSVTCTSYLTTGYVRQYADGKFNGSIYVNGSNSTSTLSNSLFQVLSDTRNGIPQFQVQDGGPDQASFIVRSFIVVNQNNSLLNSSQNNRCPDWGFTEIDCNTSTTGADFGVTDDIESLGTIHSQQGFHGHAGTQGTYLLLGNATAKYSGQNGSFDSTNNVFCDYTSNNFDTTGGWLFLIAEGSIYAGASADINVRINTSCVELKNNPSWLNDIPLSNLSWKVEDNPDLISTKGGFFEYYVGNQIQSKFEVRIPRGTGFTGAYIYDDSNTTQHTALTVDMDMNGKTGSVGQNIFMFSSSQLVNAITTALLLEGDASQMNSSDGVFIDMEVIGTPLTADSTIIGIKMPPGFDRLIETGSSDSLNKSYHNSINITKNVTDVLDDVEIFAADNDVLYIGNDGNFTVVSLLLSTSSSADVNLVYQYCNVSGAYETLTGVTDTTSGLQSSGTIKFPNPDDRGKCANETDGTPFSDLRNYSYIALTRTRNTLITPPVVDRIDIAGASVNMYMTDDLLRLNPVDTAPETCTATALGAIYFDISEDQMCVCISSGWVEMDDTTAACT